MAVVFVFLVVGVVLAIAAGAIGREARRLDAVPPRSVFDMDEAVEWVAENLPPDLQALLSYDDVRRVLGWNLEFFKTKGVSSNGSTPHVDTPIVVGGAETVDYVLMKAAGAGVDLSAPQVHAVLDAQLGYLRAINAIGGEAPPEDRGLTP